MRLLRDELEALWDAAEHAAANRDMEKFGGLVKLLLGYLLLETFGPEYLTLIPDTIGEPSPHRLRTARPYFFDALRAEDPEEARDFAQQCLQLAVPKVQRIWRQSSLFFSPRPGAAGP